MTENDHFCLLHWLVPRLSARSRPRNMRQKLPFLVLFDATGGRFLANWLFGDFWPFLGVKNGHFGRKWPYFEIFRIRAFLEGFSGSFLRHFLGHPIYFRSWGFRQSFTSLFATFFCRNLIPEDEPAGTWRKFLEISIFNRKCLKKIKYWRVRQSMSILRISSLYKLLTKSFPYRPSLLQYRARSGI